MKRFLTLFILIFIIFIGALLYWKFYYTYSDGYRAGLLQKFSHRGNIFKTYEGEMILSSVESNRNVALASEKFLFSVADKVVAGQIATMQGKFVTVHYLEKNGILPWRGDTRYIVDSVKLAP